MYYKSAYKSAIVFMLAECGATQEQVDAIVTKIRKIDIPERV